MNEKLLCEIEPTGYKVILSYPTFDLGIANNEFYICDGLNYWKITPEELTDYISKRKAKKIIKKYLSS